ncbi:MAG: dolichyl-phosphate-mannose-protein mannosyltransferase, partial [Parcubacteria group bacterium Athens0714_25]
MNKLLNEIFSNYYPKLLAFFSILMLFFIFLIKMEKNPYFPVLIPGDILYFLYLTVLIVSLGLIAYFEEKFAFEIFFKKTVFVLLPAQIFVAVNGFQFHLAVFAFANIFLAVAVIFLSWKYLLKKHQPEKFSTAVSIGNWLQEQGVLTLASVFLIAFAFFGFSSFNVQKFAAVDEALWTFGRIEKYWLALEKHEWERTFVSDKPGITVSIISGIGLNWITPENYAPIKWSSRIFASTKNFEEMNLALRFPILVFAAFFIPILYFFIERFSGKKSALYSIAFIGLSPILIGMVRIINPDSLLWIFTSASIFSYFSYLKRKSKIFILWSGIFLGLALLTKYVANILFIFFFFLIFLEYILNVKKYPSLKIYLRESVYNYLSIIFISLAVFYLFCPASWVNPEII